MTIDIPAELRRLGIQLVPTINANIVNQMQQIDETIKEIIGEEVKDLLFQLIELKQLRLELLNKNQITRERYEFLERNKTTIRDYIVRIIHEL